jgi:hypothetical protein
MKSVMLIGSIIAFLVLSSSYSYQTSQPPAASPYKPITSIAYFEPATISAVPGDVFTVKVMFQTDEKMYGHEIGLLYESTILEFVDTKLPSWEFIWGKYKGRYWVAGSEGQTGNVELLTFTFKAKATGSCLLHLYYSDVATLRTVLPSTEVGWPIVHDIADCSVVVG